MKQVIVAASQNVAVESASRRYAGKNSRHHVNDSRGKKPKPQADLFSEVRALVKAPKGASVVVSGVTFTVGSWNGKERVYHLAYAPPGSAFATLGEKAMILHDHLFMDKCPARSEIGFGGQLLWDHLVQNNIKEFLRGSEAEST